MDLRGSKGKLSRLQKIWLSSLVTLFVLTLLLVDGNEILVRINYSPSLDTFLEAVYFQKHCTVPNAVPNQDQNHNGIPDAIDLVDGARQEVAGRTLWDNSYYQGGYPPNGRGNDADVIWRAFAAAGYNLKGMVDADIQEHPAWYSKVIKKPDPNIDFRKVAVLDAFFQHHAAMLPVAKFNPVKPGDPANLIQWQPGDIVVFGDPPDHIAIISDRRAEDGVPLVIHNAGPWATEGDYLLRWQSKILHHFRYINPLPAKSS
jgi:uncharacterized protein YijF (DUF1287 family)